MNRKRKERLLLWVLLSVGSAVAVLIVLFALGQNMNFFYSPSDIKQGDAPMDRQIRAGGMVAVGSVQRSEESLQVAFVVTDFVEQVPVVYEGILPDLFREGEGVVVVGQLKTNGIIEASEVLAKHDETYMPPEVTDALERANQTSQVNY